MIILSLIIGFTLGIFSGLKLSERRDDRMIKEARRIHAEHKELIKDYNELTNEHNHALKRIIRLNEKYGVRE